MSDQAWSESGDLPEGIVLALRAVDQDAVDAAEMRDFLDRVPLRRDGVVLFSRSLDEVHGFTGGRRLHLQAPDGSATRLGLTVPSRDHAALAARLTELVTRARVSRRGYR